MPTRSGREFHPYAVTSPQPRQRPDPPTTSAFLNSLPLASNAARSLYRMTVQRLSVEMPSTVLFPERQQQHDPVQPRTPPTPPSPQPIGEDEEPEPVSPSLASTWLSDIVRCYRERDEHALTLAHPIPVRCPQLAFRCNCGMFDRTHNREMARVGHLPACQLAVDVLRKVNAEIPLSFEWVRPSWRCAVHPLVMSPRLLPSVPTSPGVTTPRPSTQQYCVCDHCWDVAGGPSGYPATTIAAMIEYARSVLGSPWIVLHAMDAETKTKSRAVVCRVVQELRQRLAIGCQLTGAVMIDGNGAHQCSFCRVRGASVRTYAVNACNNCAEYHEVGGMMSMPQLPPPNG
jgi:hypothetical protein